MMSKSSPHKYACQRCGVTRYFEMTYCNPCRVQILKEEQAPIYYAKLKALGYECFTDLTKIGHSKTKIKVRRIECDHTYEAQLRYIVSQASICSICGPKKRMAHALTFFKAKYTPDDPTDFLKFKRKVRNLTEQTYKANIDVINPLKHKRSRPDVNPDAWQLDHKVSIFEAYKQGWTPEQASALENLQMLPALENFKKQRFG